MKGTLRKGLCLCQARILIGAEAALEAGTPMGGPRMTAQARSTHLGRHDLDELVEKAELAHLVVKPLATALHACFQNLGTGAVRGPPGRIRGGSLPPMPWQGPRSSGIGVCKGESIS